MKEGKKNMGTYYKCGTSDGKQVFCDVNGREIVSLKCRYMKPYYYEEFDIFTLTFFTEESGSEKMGLADKYGNVVIAPSYKRFGLYGGKIKAEDENGRLIEVGNYSTMPIGNPFASNPKENPDAPTISSSTNTSTNSNNNSETGTTQTVVVEHPVDPVPVLVPVQEWQACIGCGGLGTMGCDNCGGSGTKYIGDRLHRCSRCNGGGIIPCNVCYGNKGKYVTVYR